MIKSVQGRLLLKEPAEAVVQVGGVGLGVNIPLSTYSSLPETDNPVTLFTHLHVREDQLKLFGFATPEECDLFTLLLSVNKIGPGVALQVLSSCNVEEFRQMVAGGSIEALASMVKGVGKKTAERMILELKDKIGESAGEEAVLDKSPVAHDAVRFLLELGTSPAVARKEVKKALEQTGPQASADIVVKTVFQNR